MISRRRTGNGVDAFPSVALGEDVDGLLEGCRVEQQRADVSEIDALRRSEAGLIAR